jgi:hypothetical protein
MTEDNYNPYVYAGQKTKTTVREPAIIGVYIGIVTLAVRQHFITQAVQQCRRRNSVS